jgi:hypothetical protein
MPAMNGGEKHSFTAASPSLSRGKLTQLRFPPGFDQDAMVATITW